MIARKIKGVNPMIKAYATFLEQMIRELYTEVPTRRGGQPPLPSESLIGIESGCGSVSV